MEHEEKLQEELTHRAAEYINRESNRLSLVTVTRTMLSRDGKRADILISVFPQEREEEALWFLKRKRSDFRTFLKQHTRLGRLPRIDFAIDEGEKNRQRIDALSNSE